MMKLKEMKQWEQLDVEIEFWKRIVENNGHRKGLGRFPMCRVYDRDDVLFDEICQGCPLKTFIGANCDKGTPFSEWDGNKSIETAQAMVDRISEIRNKLFRLDR